jgi:hypothetical protein
MLFPHFSQRIIFPLLFPQLHKRALEAQKVQQTAFKLLAGTVPFGKFVFIDESASVRVPR